MVIYAYSEISSFKFTLLSLEVGAEFLLGVRKSYKGLLYTHKISPDMQKHEVDQNLNMLRTIIPGDLNNEIFFWVNKEDILFADQWIEEQKITS